MIRTFLPFTLLALLLTQSLLNGDPSTDYSPSWSPDGNRISFLREIPPTSGIFSVNIDGSERTKLANDALATSPTWSPSGKRIAYVDSNMMIHVMNADGSENQKIANPYGQTANNQLVWSPDSSKIILTSTFDIIIVNADGSGSIHYADGLALTNPKWSPDGKWIAFIRPWESSIILIRAEGNSPELLINRPGIFDFAWSPDGQKIAFPYSANDGTFPATEIGIVSVSDKSLMRLTNNSEYEEHLAWSPDGTRIAFTSDSGINTMNADGSKQQLLSGTKPNDRRPLWLPDGMHLLFVRWQESLTEIYQVEASGNNQLLLSSLPVQTANYAFSPDLSQIVYENYQGGYSDLYVMGAGGGIRTKVSQGSHVTGDCWSPDSQQIAFSAMLSPGSDALYVGNLDGSAATKVSANLFVYGFNCSLNSRRLAFLGQESINPPRYAYYLVDIGSKKLTKLSSTTSERRGSVPVWSPDGASIAFSRGDVFVVDLATDTLADFTAEAPIYDAPVWSPNGKTMAFFGATGLELLDLESGELDQIYQVGSGIGSSLEWSPRGDKLSFVTFVTCCGYTTNADGAMPDAARYADHAILPNPSSINAVMINADGSEPWVMSNSGDASVPNWSPSGRYLAFIDGDRGIAIVEPNTRTVTSTGMDLYGTMLSWSPDERSIVFGEGDLYILHLGPM